VNFFSFNTIVSTKSCDCNSFPTFVKHNGAFFTYTHYLKANFNDASCHGIDAIVNRLESKTRMPMDYDRAMDCGDLYT
jgi:hypothetical protein